MKVRKERLPPSCVRAVSTFIVKKKQFVPKPCRTPACSRSALGYRDDGSVGISADDARHDRCVSNAKPLHGEDTKLRVDHPTDPTRAGGVVEGLCVAFDEGPNVRVASGGRREMRPPAHSGKGGPSRDVHCELDAADHAPAIFFGCQVAAENPGLKSGRALRSLTVPRLVGFSTTGPKTYASSNGRDRPSS
jgi:hypothetical protein